MTLSVLALLHMIMFWKSCLFAIHFFENVHMSKIANKIMFGLEWSPKFQEIYQLSFFIKYFALVEWKLLKEEKNSYFLFVSTLWARLFFLNLMTNIFNLYYWATFRIKSLNNEYCLVLLFVIFLNPLKNFFNWYSMAI